ncbi:hypothetical protein LguiA_009302 [Lonicera macranthoides]
MVHPGTKLQPQTPPLLTPVVVQPPVEQLVVDDLNHTPPLKTNLSLLTQILEVEADSESSINRSRAWSFLTSSVVLPFAATKCNININLI